MSKWVIASCLVATALSGVEKGTSTWISKKDWEAFLSSKKCDTDAVLLHDGSDLCGQLEKIPTLSYSFANLTFTPSKIAFIALAETGQGVKLQIVTRDGQNYLADLGKGKFVFNVQESNGAYVKKEIDPKKVRLIVLKERETFTATPFSKISTIEMRNGDQIPALLQDEPLVLTDGWREITLKPSEIIELSFNGGVHGRILEGGLPTELNFKFIQEPTLGFTIPQNGEKINLPWEKIEMITTFNGGFKAGDRRTPSVLNLLSTYIKNAYGDRPEAFGNTQGTLLVGASGALAVIPSEFEGLDKIGMEMMHEPSPLFDQAEETQWDLHIAFEETSMVDKFEQIAMLEPAQLQEIKEALVFDSIQKVDVDPPTFDVKDVDDAQETPLKNKTPTPALTEKDPDLTDEELELLEGLIANEEVSEKVLHSLANSHSNSIASPMQGRKGMTHVAKETLAVSSEFGAKRGVMIPTNGKPTLLVSVPSFYIDQKPVTNRDYQIFVLTTKHVPPPHWGGMQIPEGLEDKPVVNISCKDAESYATWIGRRLPSQLEYSSAIKAGSLKPEQKLKEWSGTNASANSKLVLSGNAFVTRNENWLDHNTGFRTVAD